LLRTYGEIDADCTKGGCNMGKNDAWIAATARVTGMTLLTTDKDFDYAHSRSMLKRVWIDPESKTGNDNSRGNHD
jgi:tRNA(fMet)-specific endonuclease VapC